jgi:hypothetical protein
MRRGRRRGILPSLRFAHRQATQRRLINTSSLLGSALGPILRTDSILVGDETGFVRTRYVFCEFTVFQAPTTYFSDTFGTSEPSDLKVKAAFANYMSQKSPAPGAASCQTEHDVSGHGTWQPFDSLSQAEVARKSEEALLSNKTNKRQIIETGWRYGAAQPTATAPAASSTTSDPQVAADPRLKSMSAEDRQYILDQGAYAVDYCKNNATAWLV